MEPLSSKPEGVSSAMLLTDRYYALGRLTSGILHKYNNLLGELLLRTSLAAAEDTPKKERIQLLGEMERIIHSAIALNQDLLAFSLAKPDCTEFDLNTALEPLLTLLQKTFPRNIAISSDSEAEEMRIQFSLAELYQLVLNICFWAKDALPHGGTLNFKVQEDKIPRPPRPPRPQKRRRGGSFARLDIGVSGTDRLENLEAMFRKTISSSKCQYPPAFAHFYLLKNLIKKRGARVSYRCLAEKEGLFSLYLPMKGPGLGGKE